QREGRSGESITENEIARHLYTAGLPDPDLLIRTSGEMRVSNFLLWQIAYSEIYVTETLWPDFRRPDLFAAIIDYQKRERRFGGFNENPRLTVRNSSLMGGGEWGVGNGVLLLFPTPHSPFPTPHSLYGPCP